MLANAYFLAKFRFGRAENEPAKKFANFAIFAHFANPNRLTVGFAFIGTPPGAPRPYVIDFGNECDPDLPRKPMQRGADSDQKNAWRRRAVRRVAS